MAIEIVPELASIPPRMNLPPISSETAYQIEMAFKASPDGFIINAEQRVATQDISTTVGKLIAAQTLQRITDRPFVQFSPNGVRAMVAQIHLVYETVRCQTLQADRLATCRAIIEGTIQPRPSMPVVDSAWGFWMAASLDSRGLYGALSQHDLNMQSMIDGSVVAPDDGQERYASREGALAVYGMLNSAAAPYYYG